MELRTRWWNRRTLRSLPLMRRPKSQLLNNHWLKKRLERTKKDILHHKDIKNKPQQDGRRGTLSTQSNPIPPWVGDPQTDNSCRSSPTGVRALSPTSACSVWGSGIRRRLDLSAGAPLDCGKQRLHSWRAYLGLARAKVVTLQESGLDLPSLGGSPGETGGSCGSLWGQGHWSEDSGNFHWHELSWRPGQHFGTKTWTHPTAYRLQCLYTSGQTINRVGTQPTHQQTGCLKTLWPHSHLILFSH